MSRHTANVARAALLELARPLAEKHGSQVSIELTVATTAENEGHWRVWIRKTGETPRLGRATLEQAIEDAEAGL
jgi:hypothetical protein